MVVVAVALALAVAIAVAVAVVVVVGLEGRISSTGTLVLLAGYTEKKAAIGQHIIIETVMASINHRRFSPSYRSSVRSFLSFFPSRGRGSAHRTTRMNTDEKSRESIG